MSPDLGRGGGSPPIPMIMEVPGIPIPVPITTNEVHVFVVRFGQLLQRRVGRAWLAENLGAHHLAVNDLEIVAVVVGLPPFAVFALPELADLRVGPALSLRHDDCRSVELLHVAFPVPPPCDLAHVDGVQAAAFGRPPSFNGFTDFGARRPRHPLLVPMPVDPEHQKSGSSVTGICVSPVTGSCNANRL